MNNLVRLEGGSVVVFISVSSLMTDDYQKKGNVDIGLIQLTTKHSKTKQEKFKIQENE